MTKYILTVLCKYAIDTAKQHMIAVEVERNAYREACKLIQEKLKAIFTNPDGVLEPPPPSSYTPPRSHEMEVHYSFDMDQQIQQKDRIDKCIFYAFNRFSTQVTHFNLV